MTAEKAGFAKEASVAERTADFTKRLGRDVRTFVQEKSKEVADRLEASVNDFVNEVSEASYQNSLKNVAEHFGLNTKEVERILRAHTPNRTSK